MDEKRLDRSSVSSSAALWDGHMGQKYNLTKFFIEFDGNPLIWVMFWQQFGSSIDFISDLDDQDKLTYLE